MRTETLTSGSEETLNMGQLVTLSAGTDTPGTSKVIGCKATVEGGVDEPVIILEAAQDGSFRGEDVTNMFNEVEDTDLAVETSPGSGLYEFSHVRTRYFSAQSEEAPFQYNNGVLK